MAPAYAPPAWGAAGCNAHGVSLEVIKCGVVVEVLSLPLDESRSFVVAGRMEPACDLVLQHPSVSRVHAALQFDALGALFLRDLGSTHGTFVNKKRLPAHEFVRLRIGDVLAFGESTRLYAVCGPQELLPPERRTSRRRKAQEGEKSKEEDTGASWGFREDAQEEEEEDDEEEDGGGKKEKGKEQLPDYLRNLKEEDTPYTSSLKKAELNEKDQRLFQQLQAKITKMENLKQEKARILAKQYQLTGLTEGQQQQLARNEQRIEALLREIEDAEEKIHTKNAQREQTAAKSVAGATRKKASANETLYGYDSDEDDFYDRTRSNQQRHEKRKQQVAAVGANGANQPVAKATGAPKVEALTASDIEAKIRMLEGDLVKVKEQLSAIELEESNKVADKGKEEEVDSLDSFMDATSKQLVESDRDAVTRRKNELEKELARQRQLLAITTPALSSISTKEPQTASQVEGIPAGATHEAPLPSAQASSPGLGKHKSSAPREQPHSSQSGSANKGDQATVQLTPASSAPIENLPAHTVSKRSAYDDERPPARESVPKSRSSEPTRRVEVDEPVCDVKKRRVVGPAMPPSLAKAEVVGETNVLEGGDSVWVPPKNQTGDGRTALNDKFGY